MILGVPVKSKPKKPKRCKECNKPLDNKRLTYCNYTCSGKADSRRKRLKKKATISEKDLDVIWSKVIRGRAGQCEYCGSKEYLNAHHIYSRTNRTLRWELDNGICLCSKHHTMSSEFSAHKAPTEFTEWLIGYKGQEFIDNLKELKRSIVKPDRQVVKDYLTEQLNSI